jgi:hypothetical protein
MTEHIGEMMEAHKALIGRQRAQQVAEKGYISSYNPNEISVKVFFPHDLAAGSKVPRGPFKLVSPWVGNGWGLVAAPIGGDLDGQGNPTGEPCMVIFYDEAGELGDCLLGTFNAKFRPPAVPGGELWIVHKQGQTIKVTNDGNVQVTGAKVLLGDASASDPAAKANETLARIAAIEAKLGSVCTTLGGAVGSLVPLVTPFIADTSNIKSSKVFISS